MPLTLWKAESPQVTCKYNLTITKDQTSVFSSINSCYTITIVKQINREKLFINIEEKNFPSYVKYRKSYTFFISILISQSSWIFVILIRLSFIHFKNHMVLDHAFGTNNFFIEAISVIPRQLFYVILAILLQKLMNSYYS